MPPTSSCPPHDVPYLVDDSSNPANLLWVGIRPLDIMIDLSRFVSSYSILF